LDLSNLFTSFTNEEFMSFDGYEVGYMTSLNEIVRFASKRAQGISENKLLDWIIPENDKNYNRGNVVNSRKLESIISKLSMTTSIVTSFDSLNHMLGIREFFPVNIQTLLRNFQTVSNSSQNILNVLNSTSPYKGIVLSLVQDYQLQFGNNKMSLSDILQIKDQIQNSMPSKGLTPNNALRSILSLPVRSLLPNGFQNILEYADVALRIQEFAQNSPNFLNGLKAQLKQLDNNTKVNSYVKASNYNKANVYLGDPLGFVGRGSFADEYSLNSNKVLCSVVSDYIGKTNFDNSGLVHTITEYSDDVIKGEIARSNIILPNLYDVTTGIKADSYNRTRDAFLTATETFVQSVINSDKIYDVKDPGFSINKIGTTKQEPSYVDYLVNLKRNIRARIEILNMGVSTPELARLNSVIEPNIKSKDMSIENLNKILDSINLSTNDGDNR